MPLPHPSRRGTIAMLVAYGLPVAAAIAMRAAWPSLLVPAAGPWAARLFGHSCGMDGFAPPLTPALAVAGALALGLALLVPRSLFARLFAVLWWIAWVLAALVSIANTLE
ncbi:MAG: hypothetical protein AB1726_12470 [Planctomycetota bacterium]